MELLWGLPGQPSIVKAAPHISAQALGKVRTCSISQQDLELVRISLISVQVFDLMSRCLDY